jgi:hypothetical protein
VTGVNHKTGAFMKQQQGNLVLLQTELCQVKARFPAHESAIDKLYRKDPDFKSLCADLFLCSNMINNYEAEIVEKMRALEEYREIVKELEEELSTVIKGEKD